MVGRVKTERLCRTAGGNKRLDDPPGCPGLLASGLEDHRRLERNGGQPKRVHARRIARHDQAKAGACGIEADPCARLFAKAAVDDAEVEAAGQAVQDGSHLEESRCDLLHVPPHQHERQAARRREGLDVLLGCLRVALVAQRQRLIQEQPGGLLADIKQEVAGKLFEH